MPRELCLPLEIPKYNYGEGWKGQNMAKKSRKGLLYHLSLKQTFVLKCRYKNVMTGAYTLDVTDTQNQ